MTQPRQYISPSRSRKPAPPPPHASTSLARHAAPIHEPESAPSISIEDERFPSRTPGAALPNRCRTLRGVETEPVISDFGLLRDQDDPFLRSLSLPALEHRSAYTSNGAAQRGNGNPLTAHRRSDWPSAPMDALVFLCSVFRICFLSHPRPVPIFAEEGQRAE
jgi:hypothetical protein